MRKARERTQSNLLKMERVKDEKVKQLIGLKKSNVKCSPSRKRATACQRRVKREAIEWDDCRWTRDVGRF
jgi:hypothetical protein